ncbi:hypothetical protein [Pedobacter zeae]|uniref:Uncharacterized protein n=1 Tax=Pedobacter zeae TaxID=1737356 RepID=A0A7W6K9X6_9SPHI|nr:hypothetical protein [Pedobacter zeae]MBB4107800.1 hypothetical protein [Pedobacter zeae]GGG96973.1 hypothetical protein GCM10007422_08560 [Pedobacter zeae]
MTKKKHIYFVSESIPHNGYGSFVVFYRHLIRLKENDYQITIIIPDYKDLERAFFFNEITENFNVIRVPFNAWWYPPYRQNNALLRKIRFFLIYKLVRKTIRQAPPDFIITYFYGNFLNGFAVFLKDIYKCKMGVFLHDDKNLLNKYNKTNIIFDQYIAQKSSVIWTVSENLRIFGCSTNNYVILPPIPSGYTPKSITRQPKKFTVGFSGSTYESYFTVFEFIAKALEAIGGELHIITKDFDRFSTLKAFNNIKLIPYFTNSGKAMDYLKQHCSVLFCGYPDDIERMPWIESCFPSKFVESVHLNIPIILSSPEGTSLYNWAEKNNWILFTTSPSVKTFENMFLQLENTAYWDETAKQSWYVAQNDFNPTKIQYVFEENIKALLV